MISVQKERLYYQAPSAAILMEVRLGVRLSRDTLQNAIGRVCGKHANLSSRVTADRDGGVFLTPCAPKDARVVVCETVDEENAIKRSFIQTPFDIENGEWLKNALFDTEDGCVWIVALHHLAGDGLSLLYFIRDVLYALTDPKLAWATEDFHLCDPRTLSGGLSLPLRLGMKYANKKWEKEKRTFTSEDRSRMTRAYWQDRTLAMETVQIDQNTLNQWLSACRAHGTTLTAAWIAAILSVELDAGKVGLAASIRPKGYEGVANWATGISVDIKALNTPFWDMAHEAGTQMKTKINDPGKFHFLLHFMDAISPTLIDAAYFNAYDGFSSKIARTMCGMFGYSGNPQPYSVTNLMRSPISDASVQSISFYPPMVANARRLFGLVTAGDRLTVTYQTFDPSKDAIGFLLQAVRNMTDHCVG